jgi:hypothetical protein
MASKREPGHIAAGPRPSRDVSYRVVSQRERMLSHSHSLLGFLLDDEAMLE